MTIELAKALTLGQTDTPLDSRTRVTNLAGMATVQNPYLGMIVYCVADGKHYKVTTLKAKQIGALTVPNAAIDTYAPIGATDLSELSDTSGILNAIPSDLSDLSDPSNLQLSPNALALGKNNLVGGYMANADQASLETGTVRLTPLDTEPLDPAKYPTGGTLYLAHNPMHNDPAALTILGSTVEYETDGITVKSVTLALQPPAEFTMPTINTDMKAVAIVADPDCDTTTESSGSNNVVTGEASGADGSNNIIAGLGSHVFGVGNSLFGNLLYVSGSGNLVEGDSLTVDGVGNVVKGLLNGVSGNGNTVNGQGIYALGEMVTVNGVNGIAVGRSITMSDCNLSVAIGTQLSVAAKNSVTAGYQLNNSADYSILLGRYGTLTREPRNEGAFAVAGGANNAPLEIFAVRSRKNIPNPLYNPTLDPQNTGTDSTGERQYIAAPAARTTYAGQLTPKSQSVTLSGAQTVTLDADKFSRIVLAGTGTATLALANWQDCDKCELVIDTTTVTPVIPIAWVMPDIDLTAAPRLYVLEIAQIGATVFVAVKYPDIAESGGASNAELSEHVADTVRHTTSEERAAALAGAATLASHTGNSTIHITSTERTNWNAKANPDDIPSDLSELSDTSELLAAKADSSALTSHTGSTANPHGVTKAQVGLGNVDNTSDANKPVSTAQQTALNAKADAVRNFAMTILSGSYTPTWSDGDFQYGVLSGNMMLLSPSSIPASGLAMILEITVSSSYSLTLDTDTYTDGIFLVTFWRSGTNIRSSVSEV